MKHVPTELNGSYFRLFFPDGMTSEEELNTSCFLVTRTAEVLDMLKHCFTAYGLFTKLGQAMTGLRQAELQ